MTRIPPELIFYIIGFLQGDKSTLSACSLSCSSLATASRPLLFHTIRTRGDPKSVRRLEGVLESPQTVLAFVKKIDMAISNEIGTDLGRMATAIYRIVTNDYIRNAPPALNISVQLANLNAWDNIRQFKRSVLPKLGSTVDWVTSIALERLDLSSDIPFWDLVLTFSNLESLTLGHVVIGGEGVQLPLHRESRISHIRLKECALNHHRCNIRWFLSAYPMRLPLLTCLDVRFSTPLGRDHIRLGEHYGPTVRTLRFGVVARAWNADSHCFSPTEEFMSRFSNLDELTLQGLFAPSGPLHTITSAWVPVALNGVPPTLRKLTVEIVVGHLSHLDTFLWSAMDEILASRLQSVEIVEILLATPIGKAYLLDGVYQDIERRLPLAAQRGVLRCSAVAEHLI